MIKYDFVSSGQNTGQPTYNLVRTDWTSIDQQDKDMAMGMHPET
jgi:hypothetical protein